MSSPHASRTWSIPAVVRRRCVACANANALIWAIGNGLVSSTLVVYLALGLGAAGIGISFILAAPRIVGILRLAVPALIARLRRRKAVCCWCYALSMAVLAAVPLAALPYWRRHSAWGIALLVSAWCVYHLMEYIAGVALWSWLGDLYPGRIRGRLLGRRERWKIAGRVCGMISSVVLILLWSLLLPTAPRWTPLALSAGVGTLFMLMAVVPLAYMPALEHLPSAQPRAPWQTLIVAMKARPYRRLLAYRCWFSIVNGITAVAQGMYPRNVLGVSYEALLTMQGGMRVGQGALAPAVGKWADRWGNRPIMIASQLMVATAPLFFLAATPDRWWVLAGAYLVWIGYAGLNVGLDNVKLKLAPADNNAPYLAIYHAVGELAYGLATVAGGVFFDVLRSGGKDAMTIYITLFAVGWIGRTLAAVLLARIPEPGAAQLFGTNRNRKWGSQDDCTFAEAKTSVSGHPIRQW